jgi:hypothetical protein
MTAPVEHWHETHDWRLGATCGDCAERYRRNLAANRSPDFSPSVFGSVPGGTTPSAARLDHQHKFDSDMHAYREAVRAGEQPDRVSAEAVEKNRRNHDLVERVIDSGSVEVVDG